MFFHVEGSSDFLVYKPLDLQHFLYFFLDPQGHGAFALDMINNFESESRIKSEQKSLNLKNLG